jgi:type IX secretion system PorP/SprF family membrane protein
MIKRFTLIKTLFTFLVVFLTLPAIAQDIHYSQFYESPLTLNPALTGINDCRYRICVNYRNQWSSIPAPYNTPSISFDINSLAPKVIKTGNLSAGLLLYDDESGDGHLNNLSIIASGGYMIHPDVAKEHSVSIGVQVGYTQKTIDFSKLTFESQFNQSVFDPNLPSYESYKPSMGYVNLNAGILWMYKPSDKLKIYAGGAAFNVIQPTESFLQTNPLGNKLPIRFTLHGGADIDINDKSGIVPSIIYMSQAGSNELNLGAAYRYSLQGNLPAKLYFGAYYRVGDAIIPTVAMDYQNFRVGLSYDVNASSLSTATGYKGGFELSINYTGCISSIVDVKPIQWCPRF